VANEIHQVGGILAIVDRERAVEADLVGIFAQEPRADAVEGARPSQCIGHDGGILAHHLRRNSLHAPGHLGRGAARKRQQHDATRVGAIDDQMRHPMCQRVGLAGAGTGNHKER
jgi:hypothetical protein